MHRYRGVARGIKGPRASLIPWEYKSCQKLSPWRATHPAIFITPLWEPCVWVPPEGLFLFLGDKCRDHWCDDWLLFSSNMYPNKACLRSCCQKVYFSRTPIIGHGTIHGNGGIRRSPWSVCPHEGGTKGDQSFPPSMSSNKAVSHGCTLCRLSRGISKRSLWVWK